MRIPSGKNYSFFHTTYSLKDRCLECLYNYTHTKSAGKVEDAKRYAGMNIYIVGKKIRPILLNIYFFFLQFAYVFITRTPLSTFLLEPFLNRHG